MYGGKMEDGSLSSELWLYEVTGGRWSLRALSSKVQPPPLARHTITLTNDGWIYLVGGATEQGQFSSKIFKIKLKTGIVKLRIKTVIYYKILKISSNEVYPEDVNCLVIILSFL